MRVSTANRYEAAVDSLQQRQRDMAEAQTAMTNGKRINKPSDDPTGAARPWRVVGGHLVGAPVASFLAEPPTRPSSRQRRARRRSDDDIGCDVSSRGTLSSAKPPKQAPWKGSLVGRGNRLCEGARRHERKVSGATSSRLARLADAPSRPPRRERDFAPSSALAEIRRRTATAAASDAGLSTDPPTEVAISPPSPA